MIGIGDTSSSRRSVQVALVTAGLLSLVGLVKPQIGNAAVVYRIELQPPAPDVGEHVAISIATFEADSLSPGAALDPLPLDDFPWNVVADGPHGERIEIPLVRDGDSGNRWTGTVAFTEEGRWEVGLDKKHLGDPPDPALGARLEVVVGSERGPRAIALLAAVSIASSLVVLAALRLRGRGVR